MGPPAGEDHMSPRGPHQSLILNHPSYFAAGLYTCSLTLQPVTDQQTRALSMSMTNVLVQGVLEGSVFSGEETSTILPLEPGLYSDQSELLLSNLHPSAELTIYGPTPALSNLEVSQKQKEKKKQKRDS